MCTHRLKFCGSEEWYPISQPCRDRVSNYAITNIDLHVHIDLHTSPLLYLHKPGLSSVLEVYSSCPYSLSHCFAYRLLQLVISACVLVTFRRESLNLMVSFNVYALCVCVCSHPLLSLVSIATELYWHMSRLRAMMSLSFKPTLSEED